MNRAQTLALLAIAMGAGVIGFGTGARAMADGPVTPSATTVPSTTTTIRTIQEDDPEWECATMGNKVCGPLAMGSDNDGVSVLLANGSVIRFPWEATEDCTIVPIQSRSVVCALSPVR